MRRRLLIIFSLIALFVVACITALAFWLHSELGAPYYSAQIGEVFVDIQKGATANEVASLLVHAGILKNRIPFVTYLRYTGKARQIQAGEYRFCGPDTPIRIAQRLIQGDVHFYSITIPEGLTAGETIALLAHSNLGNIAEMERALLNTDWIRDLDPKAKNLEGYLFPETYRFGRKSDSETILKTMVNQFRLRISKIMAESAAQSGWSISSLVILASMIEKEAKQLEERPLVASVLVNRLRKRIPLACDATIIYALKLAGTYKGNLRKVDMEMDSPYNSYLHLGLPPGPIANPGADSLRAALNPAETDYLYYVSRNDGTHQFSKDFRSHLQAVNKFQRANRGRQSSRSKSDN